MTEAAADNGGGARAELAGMVRAARPKHWLKNFLVVAAPLAAGLGVDGFVVGRVAVAFLALSLAASGTYLVNDVLDVEADRRHPVKRLRPVASGQVPTSAALVEGITLLALGIGLPAALGLGDLAVVVAIYAATTTAYSLGMKHVPIVELAFVAAGFVIRAVAGAVAVDVPVSRWFLIVVSAGALHLVATKRFAEARNQAEGDRRPVLSRYPGDVLAEVRFTTAAVTAMAYVLWAFETAEASTGPVWHELSIVPVVLALFRYGAAVHEGAGEAPEDVFLRDRTIQVLGLVWLGLYLAGVYGVGA